MMSETFHFKFQEFTDELRKIYFQLEKMGFWDLKMPPTKNSEVNETILEKVKVLVGL